MWCETFRELSSFVTFTFTYNFTNIPHKKRCVTSQRAHNLISTVDCGKM